MLPLSPVTAISHRENTGIHHEWPYEGQWCTRFVFYIKQIHLSQAVISTTNLFLASDDVLQRNDNYRNEAWKASSISQVCLMVLQRSYDAICSLTLSNHWTRMELCNPINDGFTFTELRKTQAHQTDAKVNDWQGKRLLRWQKYSDCWSFLLLHSLTTIEQIIRAFPLRMLPNVTRANTTTGYAIKLRSTWVYLIAIMRQKRKIRAVT